LCAGSPGQELVAQADAHDRRGQWTPSDESRKSVDDRLTRHRVARPAGQEQPVVVCILGGKKLKMAENYLKISKIYFIYIV
jgi:hypothetical protein